jgi:O-antigen ligase
MTWFSPAMNRFVAPDSLNELRVAVLPVLLAMTQRFALFGSGFGSFEHVYKASEPAELLSNRYLNQAHNDWLQLVIEGGVVAAVLFVLIALWAVRQFAGIAAARKAGDANLLSRLVAGGFFLALLGIGSLVDYPLRTPSLMATAVLLLALLRPFASDRRHAQENSH